MALHSRLKLNIAHIAAAALVCAIAPTAALSYDAPLRCAGARPATIPVQSHHSRSLAALDKVAPPSGVRAVRSGAWSDPGTWGGRRPAGGAVFIPNGVSVVVDAVDAARLKSVRVEGCLEMSSRVNSRITAETVYIAPKGEFVAGAPTAPLPPTITAEIIFPDLGPINASIDPMLLGKGFISASRVGIYGATKSPRAQFQRAPRKGEQSIALAAAPVGWRVGDRLVVTGTRWIARQYNGDTKTLTAPTEDEVRYVKAISGAMLTLDAPLSFDHPSPDGSMQGYVLNYSRNFRFATENGAKAPVAQRGHAMAMSPQTYIQGAEFFEMGRTDKSVRAIDAGLIGTTVRRDNTTTFYAPSPTANVKGRYGFHLHQVGFPADDMAPVIRDSAVWGSPGWGFAQHSSKAFFFRNNTFNTFGAGFVSESGDELGAWVENSAVRAVGLPRLVKDGADVAAFDLARTGDGFWLQGRMIRMHRNLAAGMMSGMGYVFMHRGTDLAGARPLSLDFINAQLCTPGASRNRDQLLDNPQIQQFTDNEAFAAYTGFHVVKSNPTTSHDMRSVIDAFRAFEVVNGIELTYSSRYLIKNAKLISAAAKTKWRTHTGVDLLTNTFDIAIVNSSVANFDFGVNLAKSVTSSLFAPQSFTVAGLQSTGIRNAVLRGRDGSDQILASAPPPRRAAVAYKWGAGPTFIDKSGPNSVVRFAGSKTDSFGAIRYPMTANEFMLDYAGYNDLMRREGWFTLASGEKALAIADFYSDRMTGEIEQARIVARLHSMIRPPATRMDGAPANLGRLDPFGAPPAAANDQPRVASNGVAVFDARANDRSNDGALRVNAFTTARHGNVRLLPDGRFEYRPYPDFRGQDQFQYWIVNRQNAPAKATVSVTVY